MSLDNDAGFDAWCSWLLVRREHVPLPRIRTRTVTTSVAKTLRLEIAVQCNNLPVTYAADYFHELDTRVTVALALKLLELVS